MNLAAFAEDIGSHLRVPAMRLVAEVSAGFEQAAHGEIGKRHIYFSG